MEKNESPIDRRPVAKKATRPLFGRRSSSKGLATQLSNGSSQRSVDSVARQNLASTIEQHGSGRKSLSESILVDPNPSSGNVSLRKQFSNEEEYNRTQKVAKRLEDEGSSLQVSGITAGSLKLKVLQFCLFLAFFHRTESHDLLVNCRFCFTSQFSQLKT